MRTFVDLENGPGNLARATGALGAAGVDLIDYVGLGEGSGLGLRIWCGSVDAARAAFVRARLSVEELDESPAPHVELVFDDGAVDEDAKVLVPA